MLLPGGPATSPGGCPHRNFSPAHGSEPIQEWKDWIEEPDRRRRRRRSHHSARNSTGDLEGVSAVLRSQVSLGEKALRGMVLGAMKSHTLGQFADGAVNGEDGRCVGLLGPAVRRLSHGLPPRNCYTGLRSATATKSSNNGLGWPDQRKPN